MRTDSSPYSKALTWRDNEHLQVGDTSFLVTLDWFTADVTESTLEQFLLVKNRYLIDTMLPFLPEQPANIVEFGIFKGGSIALYEELFQPSRMVGVDIKDDRVAALDELLRARSATDRVRLYYATDQCDQTTLKSIARENFGDQPIDLVLDDGAHRYEPSRISFNEFFPRLRRGGVYVIEDWAWAHWPGNEHEKYSDQSVPLSQLVFEVAMLSASRPGLVQEVTIEASRTFVTRGGEEISPEDFDISRAYLTSQWNIGCSKKTDNSVPRRWRRRRAG